MVSRFTQKFALIVVVVATLNFVNADTPATAPKSAATPASASLRTVEKSELKTLRALNEKYRTTKAATMTVAKTVKLGLIGGERKSAGQLSLSSGQLRMELEGSEKTLLVVNKKNLWAVTYPPAELNDAALQVIRGDMTSKKAQGQALTGLLGAGGFLKHFKPTGVQVTESGESLYFLQPLKTGSEFKRAQLLVSKDKQEIRELRFWDERDNETSFTFTNVKFGGNLDSKLFTYSPPANADVMDL